MGPSNTCASRPRPSLRSAGTIVLGACVALSALIGGCGSASSDSPATTTVTSETTSSMATTTTVNPATLPQTDARPITSGDGFGRRMQALASAIIADDSSKGLSAFFPVEAYKQVKKNTDPAADWKNRLIAEFGVDTTDAHRLLGSGAATATFLGADVPDAAVWVKPGEEYNLIGYWRVYGTKLRFDVGGTVKIVPVSSLISWRGEWYVVHLGAIR